MEPYKINVKSHCITFITLQKKRFRDDDLIVNFKDLGGNNECFIVPIFRSVYGTQPSSGSILIHDEKKLS
jgi:hypothetical protein